MNKLALAVVLVVAGVMASGMAQAQSTLKPGSVKECPAEENGCNNRPDVSKTRALKPKPVKECEENGCNNRSEAQKTRGLKSKKGKECPTAYCE